MTIKEIEKRLADIEEDKGDNEEAHYKEDRLMFQFIEHLAQRDDLIGRKAKLVLKLNDIEYVRWYA